MEWGNGMGALMRETREELELLNGDSEWWGRVLDEVRESGGPRELVEGSSWSYGAFIGWVRGDEGRGSDYDQALRDHGHRLGMSVVPLADGATVETVGVVKLQTDVRLKVAGKLDRAKWGEKVDHIGVVLDPLSEMLREISERRLKALRELSGMSGASGISAERVIDAVDAVDAVVEVEDDGEI